MIKLCRGRWQFWAVLVVGFGLGKLPEPVQAGESRAKVAIATSLTTADDHLRQHAFDGKADTWFEATEPTKADDAFTLVLDEPAEVKGLSVATGRPDESARLEAAKLEISTDGIAFEEVATVGTDGLGRAEFPGRQIRSIRVRATKAAEQPVIIREFTIDSARVQPFQHPVEFTVKVEDAPDLQTWTEETARLCEQWYDALNAELPSEGFEPRKRITLRMTPEYRGVAAAGNGRITGSVAYFEKHRKDQGAMVHETVHVIQNYRSRNNPGWLVEGVADYVRFFFFEPGKAGPVNPDKARYDASYRTTATFLDYLSRTYDPLIVQKLNKAMRAGTYDKAIFEQVTGKPVETLNDDWIASLRR